MFNGRKKLINKAAKDEPMMPITTQSMGVLKSKLKNFVIKNLPKTRQNKFVKMIFKKKIDIICV